MSKKKRKNTKKRKPARQLISTKPRFGYYLLMMFFPVVFLLVDDTSEIFKRPWNLNWETLSFVFFLFICFGIPLIMFLLRREVKLFEDRLVLRWPSINKTMEYSMEQLKSWEYLDFYVQNAGRQKNLNIWFENSRKIEIHGLQANKLQKLIEYFEKNYADKKKQREPLGDRLAEWIKFK